MIVLDVDVADEPPFQAALVGDGADDLARGDAVAVSDLDAVLDQVRPIALAPVVTVPRGAGVRTGLVTEVRALAIRLPVTLGRREAVAAVVVTLVVPRGSRLPSRSPKGAGP